MKNTTEYYFRNLESPLLTRNLILVRQFLTTIEIIILLATEIVNRRFLQTYCWLINNKKLCPRFSKSKGTYFILWLSWLAVLYIYCLWKIKVTMSKTKFFSFNKSLIESPLPRDVLYEFHLKFWNTDSIDIPVRSLL